MARINCIGDSHITAVKRSARRVDPNCLLYHSNLITEAAPGGGHAVKPEYLETLRSAPGPIFSMIGGNAHNAFGLIRPTPLLDFHHPDHPEFPPEEKTTVVPFAQIRDAVEHRAGTRLSQFDAVCAAFPGRVVHIESPPPTDDQAFMVDKLRPRMEAAGISEFEVAPAGLRFKLWRVNCAIFAEACRRLGVPVVLPPKAARTDAGFLLPRLRRDPTHANSAYGALVVAQMMEVCDVAPV